MLNMLIHNAFSHLDSHWGLLVISSVKVKVLVAQSCLTEARQAPLSIEFSRQEYCSGFPCPPPGDLSDPGMEPESPMFPALQTDSLPVSHQPSPMDYSTAQFMVD